MALREEPLAEYRVLDLRVPSPVEYSRDVDWVFRSLGFLEPRDKEKTAARIFKAILEAAQNGKGLASDDWAKRLG